MSRFRPRMLLLRLAACAVVCVSARERVSDRHVLLFVVWPNCHACSDGMYNADPHPGNFLISTQAHRRHEPILLDFGLCTRLTPALRRALAKLVRSSELSVAFFYTDPHP